LQLAAKPQKTDLKSAGRKAVGVQVPLRAPNKINNLRRLATGKTEVFSNRKMSLKEAKDRRS